MNETYAGHFKILHKLPRDLFHLKFSLKNFIL